MIGAKFPHRINTVGCGFKFPGDRKNDMSLVYCYKAKDTLYIAADSRSTMTRLDENGNIVERAFDDTYRKIAKKNKVFFTATGQNNYNGKNLTELVYSSKNSIEIYNTISKYKTTLFAFEVGKDKIRYIDEGEEKEISNKYISFYASEDKIIKILNELNIPETDDESAILDFLNDVFLIAKTFSKWDDNTVGGLVHILKIKPGEPYKWLQNGYEL